MSQSSMRGRSCQDIFSHIFYSKLTRDKCHRGRVVDEGFIDTLTYICGYQNNNMSSFAKREYFARAHGRCVFFHLANP